jgi:hypothetical protein
VRYNPPDNPPDKRQRRVDMQQQLCKRSRDIAAHVASQSPALASPLPKHTVGLARVRFKRRMPYYLLASVS